MLARIYLNFEAEPYMWDCVWLEAAGEAKRSEGGAMAPSSSGSAWLEDPAGAHCGDLRGSAI